MKSRTDPKWLVLSKKVWRCPDCRETVKRPSDMLYEEDGGVKRACERHVEAALSQDDPQAYIDSLDHVHTVEWGSPRAFDKAGIDYELVKEDA